MLIVDIDLSVTVGAREDWTALWTDEELTVFYGFSLGAGTPKIFRAAAKALRAVAVSRALIARQFSIGSYSENTEKAAEILNAKAKEYEDAADKMEGPISTYVEYDWNNFAANARLWRKALYGEI